jgi:WD40 repeat protein
MNNLVPITYNNQRILTTEQLAWIYETTVDNIRMNFKNHKDRFKEEKHYYFLEGTKLKTFKNHINGIYPVDPHTSKLYLWTERGADRHCKILDTDKAWEQFDHLEETYFNVKENRQSQSLLESLDTVNKSLEIISPLLNTADVDDNIKLLVAKTFFAKAGINIPIEINAKEKYYDTKQIGSMIGMYSKSGKPAFGAVGQIIKSLDVTENEKKSVWESNGPWQGTVIKYTQSVVDKITKWLEDNGHPSDIPSKSKTFHVVYKPIKEVFM